MSNEYEENCEYVDQTNPVIASRFASVNEDREMVTVCCEPVSPEMVTHWLLYVLSLHDALDWISSNMEASLGPVIDSDKAL